jgi:hypothetical protein
LYNLVKYFFIYFKLQLQPFTIATLKVMLIALLTVAANFMLPVFNNVFIDVFFRSAIITFVFGGLILLTKSSEEINRTFYSVVRKMRL